MRNYGLVLVAVVVFGLIGCGGKSKAKGDLTVSGSPTGQIDGQVRMVLAFSHAMVPKDQIEQPATKIPFKLTPDVPHEAKWTDDKTLVVVPTSGLPLSTKFVGTVPAGTKALDGKALGDAHMFEFFTERLTGTVDVVGTKERAAKDQIVKLIFNQEVPFAQVAEHCGFSAAKQTHKVKLAPDSNAGPAKSYTLVATADLALDTDWTISCRAGLKGTVGNLGLEKAVEEKFRTYGPLRFVSLEPTGNDIVPDEGLRLKLAFSNPLKPPYQMTISPAVVGFPDRCHELGEPPGLSCGGLLDPRTSYTITIKPTQKDVFGQTIDKPQELAFRTTDSHPTISLESGYFVAELKRPVVPVWTRNVGELTVSAVDVTQANFHELSPLLEWWDNKPADFAKTKIKPREKKIKVTGTKNKWGQQPIDPSELFGRKPGPGMYYVEIGSAEVTRGSFRDGGRQKVLVNFTDIGVVSKISGSRGLVWATTLSTGKPLPGATVSVRDSAGKVTFTGTTDAEGVAILPGSSKLAGDAETGRLSEMRVYVQHQADWTMINPTATGGLSVWSFNVSQDYDRTPTKLRGFMHTDRGLYRPGDKVHVKGLARVTKLGEPLDVPGTGKKVSVEVQGPQGKTFTTAEARLSPFGGFWFDLDLPGDARLGDYLIRAKLEHGTFVREFSVEEYRPATFEVTGKAKETSLVRTGVVHATIAANYFYGAPVRSGEVDVTVHSRPRRVEFEQFAGFEFFDERKYDRYSYGYEDEDSQTMVTEDHLSLDKKGNAALSVSISADDVGSDADLLVRANVTSPSNEVISKTFTVPYFHARKYFGIKAPGYFLDVKKPAKFQVTAVSPDGKVVDGTAKVTVTRRDWNCVYEDWGYNGSYQCKDTNQTILSKMLPIVGGKPADLEFTPDSGGDYLIVVEGENDKQEAAAAATQIYAWGDGGGSWRSDDSLKFDIVADKKEYKAGDTATLILKTDLADASGLVTVERDGVIENRLITLSPTAKHISIPITANYAPNVYVSVSLVQGRKGDGTRGKPRMRMGLVNLSVRPEDNKLSVSVETDRKDYRPGEKVTASVKVTDAAGKPVSAEVSITAADEGVLSLVGYETPNPIPSFYTAWGIGVTTATQYEFIRDIPGPNVERPASGGDAAGTLRSRFVATAVWAPGAVTNAAGVATVTFNAPDNLTAFRVMAVAADKGYRFGSGDKRFTVSKPLQLHQALPRFLNLGDELKGGVIVHNETGAAGTATVTMTADKRLTVTGGSERTVQVAKGARVPVLFDLAGAELGESVLTFSVTMGNEKDAVQLKLPVQHPSPVRVHHFAHGATKDALKIPITLPADAIAASAEVIVSVDPDGLAGIEDGLSELIRYPHGCLEQTTSKVIPMLAVRDLAESLNIEGLSGKALEGFVKEGIAKIGRHQTAYGGFSLWPGGDPEAYYTAYALWGLHLAKQSGYAVDSTRVQEGLDYLRGDGTQPDTSRPYYNAHGDLGSQAFALYIRAIYGDKSATAAATTMIANKDLPVYGKAFLARALGAGLGAKDPAVVKLVGELAALADAVTKTDALIKEPHEDMDYYMSSSMRTSAMVLAALVELDPKHASIKPLVRVLMKQRRTMRYIDTQENLYSLLALTSYAKTVGGQPPSVTVQLGDANLLSATLGGKQRMRVVTAAYSPTASEVTITPKGEVHYNVELRYRSKPETLKAQSNGLVLQQEYLDEAGKPKTSFTVGDVVVVRLTTQLKDEAEHLMVSNPLPAGFEAVNTRLATVGTAGTKQTQSWGTYQEMRDNRVDFASEYNYSGSYVHEFTMRATSVGKFARPPTIAELMYEPEVNAQSALEMIEIKAK